MKTLDELTTQQKKVALDKFCAYFGYEEQIEDLDAEGNVQLDEQGAVITKANPETKLQFLDRQQKEWAYSIAKKQYIREKRQAAQVDAQDDF